MRQLQGAGRLQQLIDFIFGISRAACPAGGVDSLHATISARSRQRPDFRALLLSHSSACFRLNGSWTVREGPTKRKQEANALDAQSPKNRFRFKATIGRGDHHDDHGFWILLFLVFFARHGVPCLIYPFCSALCVVNYTVRSGQTRQKTEKKVTT